MIRWFLLQNRAGKTRLAKYYVPLDDAEKRQTEYEVFRTLNGRESKWSNIVEACPSRAPRLIPAAPYADLSFISIRQSNTAGCFSNVSMPKSPRARKGLAVAVLACCMPHFKKRRSLAAQVPQHEYDNFPSSAQSISFPSNNACAQAGPQLMQTAPYHLALHTVENATLQRKLSARSAELELQGGSLGLERGNLTKRLQV
jgi:hypothetical protein